MTTPTSPGHGRPLRRSRRSGAGVRADLPRSSAAGAHFTARSAPCAASRTTRGSRKRWRARAKAACWSSTAAVRAGGHCSAATSASPRSSNGWAGVIIHGCIRDSAELGRMDLGIRALGTMPLRSDKRGEGERDVPVRFAGATFRPGELRLRGRRRHHRRSHVPARAEVAEITRHATHRLLPVPEARSRRPRARSLSGRTRQADLRKHLGRSVARVARATRRC